MTNNFFKDFKEWFSTQKKKKTNEENIGCYVQSKLNAKNLIEKITLEENIINDDNKEYKLMKKICKDFKENGGTIIKENNDGMLTIEVDSGLFTIHKYFIKK